MRPKAPDHFLCTKWLSGTGTGPRSLGWARCVVISSRWPGCWLTLWCRFISLAVGRFVGFTANGWGLCRLTSCSGGYWFGLVWGGPKRGSLGRVLVSSYTCPWGCTRNTGWWWCCVWIPAFRPWISCVRVRSILRKSMARWILARTMRGICSYQVIPKRNRNTPRPNRAFGSILKGRFFSCRFSGSFIAMPGPFCTTTWSFGWLSCTSWLTQKSGRLLSILLPVGTRPCCKWWLQSDWNSWSKTVEGPYLIHLGFPLTRAPLPWKNIEGRCDTCAPKSERYQRSRLSKRSKC